MMLLSGTTTHCRISTRKTPQQTIKVKFVKLFFLSLALSALCTHVPAVAAAYREGDRRKIRCKLPIERQREVSVLNAVVMFGCTIILMSICSLLFE